MEINNNIPTKEPFDKNCIKTEQLPDGTWMSSYESKDGNYKTYQRSDTEEGAILLLAAVIGKYFDRYITIV